MSGRESYAWWLSAVLAVFLVVYAYAIAPFPAQAGGGTDYELRQLNRAVQTLQKRVHDLERIPEIKDWLDQQRARDREREAR